MLSDCVIYCAFYSILFRGAVFSGHGVLSNLDIKLNSHQLLSETVVVISYQLRLRDGTETSSTLRRWSSARRAVVPSELMWPLGVLCTQSETVELSA